MAAARKVARDLRSWLLSLKALIYNVRTKEVTCQSKRYQISHEMKSSNIMLNGMRVV